MSVVFKNPDDFWKETAAVTAGAAAAGVAVGLAGLLGAPLATATGAAALFGASVGAALTRPVRDGQPKKTAVRALLGAVGGVMAGLGFAALSWRFGLGVLGSLAGGSLGGLALASLLGAEEQQRDRRAQAAGLIAATIVGGAGAVALDNAARFVISEQAPVPLATGTLAGLLALWIASAAGVRRVQRQTDPLSMKAEEVLERLAEPVRSKVHEGLSTWAEIEGALARDAGMTDETKDETRKQARVLVDALLETARTWGQIHEDIRSPKVKAVDDKLADLDKRLNETSDEVTRGHLARALTALQAQKSAIDGLKVGMGRAEAAVDAQLALLERLRLAVAQHRVSDRERFSVELCAVAEQASRLSDDLESLSAAIAEAETLADRRVLADLERGARRALSNLPDPVVERKVDEVAEAARR